MKGHHAHMGEVSHRVEKIMLRLTNEVRMFGSEYAFSWLETNKIQNKSVSESFSKTSFLVIH